MDFDRERHRDVADLLKEGDELMYTAKRDKKIQPKN